MESPSGGWFIVNLIVGDPEKHSLPIFDGRSSAMLKLDVVAVNLPLGPPPSWHLNSASAFQHRKQRFFKPS